MIWRWRRLVTPVTPIGMGKDSRGVDTAGLGAAGLASKCDQTHARGHRCIVITMHALWKVQLLRQNYCTLMTCQRCVPFGPELSPLASPGAWSCANV